MNAGVQHSENKKKKQENWLFSYKKKKLAFFK